VFSVILRLIPEVKEANSNHYLSASGICSNQEWNRVYSDYIAKKKKKKKKAGVSITIINHFPLRQTF